MINFAVLLRNGAFIILCLTHPYSMKKFIASLSSCLHMLMIFNDILIAGNDSSVIQSIISDLDKSFSLKSLGPVQYFLWFEVVRTTSSLHLNQIKYIIDLLTKTNMLQAKSTSTPMILSNKLHLQDSDPFP